MPSPPPSRRAFAASLDWARVWPFALLARPAGLGRERISEAAWIMALALACSYLLFAGIGSFGVLNGGEALYAESAREMLATGNIAIPSLNGLPYLEKPPLTVWLLALAIRAFGASEWALRLVSAASALAAVAAVFYFARVLRLRGSPWVAAGIASSSFGLMLMSRVAMPDAVLTALFGAGSFAFAAALRHESRAQARFAFAAIGLAALAKGLVAIVLFGLILFASWMLLHTTRARLVALLRDPLMPIMLFGPVLAWLLGVELALPGAARIWVFGEQVLRFLGLREPHDYYSGSPLYYFPRLFLLAFPWAGALAAGWWAARREPSSQERTELRRLLWACVWIPCAFFSVSQAKANYYLVICLPAMALLTAEYLPALLASRRPGPIAFAIALAWLPALAVLVLASRRLGAAAGEFPRLDACAPLLVGSLLGIGALGLACLAIGRRQCALGCLAAMMLPVHAGMQALTLDSEPIMSARPVAKLLREEFPHRPVLLYQDYEAMGGLPFYLDRLVPVIDSRSADLVFGQRQHPDSSAFVSEADVAAGALVVVRQQRERAFAASSLARRAVAVRNVGPVRLYEIVPAAGLSGMEPIQGPRPSAPAAW